MNSAELTYAQGHARGSATLHCQPESPPGLAESEQHVMASDAPAVPLIDRALIRALLRDVHRLERTRPHPNLLTTNATR